MTAAGPFPTPAGGAAPDRVAVGPWPSPASPPSASLSCARASPSSLTTWRHCGDVGGVEPADAGRQRRPRGLPRPPDPLGGVLVDPGVGVADLGGRGRFGLGCRPLVHRRQRDALDGLLDGLEPDRQKARLVVRSLGQAQVEPVVQVGHRHAQAEVLRRGVRLGPPHLLEDGHVLQIEPGLQAAIEPRAQLAVDGVGDLVQQRDDRVLPEPAPLAGDVRVAVAAAAEEAGHARRHVADGADLLARELFALGVDHLAERLADALVRHPAPHHRQLAGVDRPGVALLPGRADRRVEVRVERRVGLQHRARLAVVREHGGVVEAGVVVADDGQVTRRARAQAPERVRRVEDLERQALLDGHGVLAAPRVGEPPAPQPRDTAALVDDGRGLRSRHQLHRQGPPTRHLVEQPVHPAAGVEVDRPRLDERVPPLGGVRAGQQFVQLAALDDLALAGLQGRVDALVTARRAVLDAARADPLGAEDGPRPRGVAARQADGHAGGVGRLLADAAVEPEAAAVRVGRPADGAGARRVGVQPAEELGGQGAQRVVPLERAAQHRPGDHDVGRDQLAAELSVGNRHRRSVSAR